MKQSRKHSAIESLTNVIVGYGIAVGAQMLIFPLFGVHLRPSANMLIAVFFTAVSLVRSYTVRRVFNGWHKVDKVNKGELSMGSKVPYDNDASQEYMVEIFGTTRRVRRFREITPRSIFSGLLVFTDCIDPTQKLIVPESEIKSWRRC